MGIIQIGVKPLVKEENEDGWIASPPSFSFRPGLLSVVPERFFTSVWTAGPTARRSAAVQARSVFRVDRPYLVGRGSVEAVVRLAPVLPGRSPVYHVGFASVFPLQKTWPSCAVHAA